MEIRSCRVTIADMDGVAHTVEVMAARLFEAVPLGLKQLQGNEWVTGLGRPMDMVTVAVKSVPVEHHVRIGEFTKWLERSGTTPAEVTRKRKCAKFWPSCAKLIGAFWIALVATTTQVSSWGLRLDFKTLSRGGSDV
jgi:hypothetical protein